MTYDNYGNIQTKNGVEYTYGDENWKDLLTGVGDQFISYDAQGNPISYLGHTLTWEKGRQLKSFDDIQYTYNANGIRTSKTVNGVKHTYILDGIKILYECWNENMLISLRDDQAGICGIVYNNVPYYFVKNLQGDIIAIVNKDAETVARYSYDAWGVCTVTKDISGCDIANINPYRYRSYYFDLESGLYYLQSRYYDAQVGRFVNGDMVEIAVFKQDVLGHNLFGYGKNSSTNTVDMFGFSATLVIGGITLSAGQAIAIIAVFVICFSYIFDKSFRNAVNQMIIMFIQGLVDGVGYIANVINEIITKAKRGRKYSGYELHHIVAQKDFRAKLSRNLLKKYGISTYIKENTVSIKKTLHKHIHTNSYHAAVYLILLSVSKSKGSWYQKRQKLLAVLVSIGVLLSMASSAV